MPRKWAALTVGLYKPIHPRLPPRLPLPTAHILATIQFRF